MVEIKKKYLVIWEYGLHGHWTTCETIEYDCEPSLLSEKLNRVQKVIYEKLRKHDDFEGNEWVTVKQILPL